jgi:hypothetical protein
VSIEFHIRTGRRVPRAIIAPPVADLRWHGREPPDPLTPGGWLLFRAGVSTRLTTVVYAPRRLSVTVQSGACLEDCDLALRIVRRAAKHGDGKVDSDEFSMLTLDQFDEVFGEEWARRQLESAARVCVHLARERGPIAMPGPTRNVWIGPRVLQELEDGDPAAAGERLVTVMRRVLWPDPRYEAASVFEVTGPGDQPFTLAMLLPDRPCVLPRTDRLAIDSPDGTFVIPRAALIDLPVELTWLDDGNHLVEGVSGPRWAELCQAARVYELSS